VPDHRFDGVAAIELFVDGELIYVYADSHAKKSVAIPDAWRERLV
jgi:acyl-CoA thioesterase FadM